MIGPEEAVDRIAARFGAHSGRRALHARGVFCAGTFRASAEGAALTTAAHMQGDPVPILARFSNGSGDPAEPDRAADVRGLAVRFDLGDGAATDVVAQTAPRFPVRSPDAFIALLEATERGPGMLLRLPAFLARHPGAAAALRANAAALRPPASYADPRYYAIHAFRWTGADGTRRWVRYELAPASPAAAAPDRSASGYLTAELATASPVAGAPSSTSSSCSPETGTTRTTPRPSGKGRSGWSPAASASTGSPKATTGRSSTRCG